MDVGGGKLEYSGGIDLFVAKFDAAGAHVWSKSFGGSDHDRFHSVLLDPEGNPYVTGRFRSPSIDLGGGPIDNENPGDDDIFLVKMDSEGSHLWSKVFGGNKAEALHSVVGDVSGNLYLTGYFASYFIDFGGPQLPITPSGDVFVAKLDGNGNHLWSKGFGGDSQEMGHSLSVDPEGGIWLGGFFLSDSIGFGGGSLVNHGNRDMFLVKFNSAGTHQWSDAFGGADSDDLLGLASGPDGHVVAVGTFESASIEFGGGPLGNAGDVDFFAVKLKH